MCCVWHAARRAYRKNIRIPGLIARRPCRPGPAQQTPAVSTGDPTPRLRRYIVRRLAGSRRLSAVRANATQAGGHRITRSQSAGKARISLLLVATRLDARRDLGQHAAGRGVVARVGDGAHRAVDEGLEAQKLQGHGALPISARGSSAASAHPAARAPTWNICRNTEIALVRGLLAGKTLAETNEPRGF